jgi:hypothetical protein
MISARERQALHASSKTPARAEPPRRAAAELAAASALAVSASLAWAIAAPPTHPPPVHARDFNLALGDRGYFSVTPQRPLLLPFSFGDCDLLATLEVPAGGEVDVVFRRADPENAHGRFALLRLSAVAEGPPYRTREQALFDQDAGGGVRLAPGVSASLRVEARGRHVRADVAGRLLPWIEVADDRGGFAFVVRGGEAVLRYLKVAPVKGPWSLPGWMWTALAALGLHAGLRLAVGGRWMAAAALGVATLAGAEVARRWLMPALDAELAPDPLARAAAALVGLPLGAALAAAVARRSWLAGGALALLGLAGGAALAEAFARREAARLTPLADPRLDLTFGWGSRSAPFDALTRRVSSKHAVHVEGETGLRVMFLGGEALFESGADRAEHVGVQVAGRLRRQLGRDDVDAVVMPTAFSHALQQLELYRRYYRSFDPRAIVFGVSRWEAEPAEPLTARARWRRLELGRERGLSVLLDLCRAQRAGGAPPSTPEELRQTLAEAAALCKEDGAALVLAAAHDVPAPYLAVVEQAARDAGAPFVRDVVTAEGKGAIAAVADALLPYLR